MHRRCKEVGLPQRGDNTLAEERRDIHVPRCYEEVGEHCGVEVRLVNEVAATDVQPCVRATKEFLIALVDLEANALKEYVCRQEVVIVGDNRVLCEALCLSELGDEPAEAVRDKEDVGHAHGMSIRLHNSLPPALGLDGTRLGVEPLPPAEDEGVAHRVGAHCLGIKRSDEAQPVEHVRRARAALPAKDGAHAQDDHPLTVAPEKVGVSSKPTSHLSSEAISLARVEKLSGVAQPAVCAEHRDLAIDFKRPTGSLLAASKKPATISQPMITANFCQGVQTARKAVLLDRSQDVFEHLVMMGVVGVVLLTRNHGQPVRRLGGIDARKEVCVVPPLASHTIRLLDHNERE
eukprot:247865-Prymnesium_polylepis.1